MIWIATKKFFHNRVLVLIIIQLFILLVSILSIFPSGTIYAGYDFPMIINPWQRGLSYLNFWVSDSLGSASVVYPYSIFYLTIGFINRLFELFPSQQSFYYYFIFLTLSFWMSLYGFRNLFSKRTDTEIVFAFLYTFNQYTYYVFYFQWAFSPFLYLYPILPLFFGLTYKYFNTPGLKTVPGNLLVLIPVFLYLNIVMGNFPFFIALMLVTIFFVFLIHIVKIPGSITDIVVKLALYFGTLFVCLLWSLIPQLLILRNSYVTATTGNIIYDLKNWVILQALSIPRALSGVPPLDAYYASNITFVVKFLYFIFPIVIVGLLIYLLYIKGLTKKHLLFLFLYLFLVALNNKGVGFFNADQIWTVFKLPFLLPLRSFDKTLIFYEFINLALILVLLENINTRLRNFVLALIIIVELSICYPLWMGWTQKYKGYFYENTNNYKTSKYKSLVKIPLDYFNIAKIVNGDPDQFRIFALPYTHGVPGFVDLPSWGVFGNNPLPQLFNKSLVHINEYALSYLNWDYGKELESDPANTYWLIKVLQTQNIRYIIFHKDIDKKYIQPDLSIINTYTKDLILTKIYSGDNADLFRINDPYFVPKIYIPDSYLFVPNGLSNYPTYLNSIDLSKKILISDNETNLANLSSPSKCQTVFKVVSSTEFKISLQGDCYNVPIVFSEMYHPNWHVYDDKGPVNWSHFVANGYSNGFGITKKGLCTYETCTFNIKYSLNLFFVPLLLINIFLACLMALIYGIIHLRVRKNENVL